MIGATPVRSGAASASIFPKSDEFADAAISSLWTKRDVQANSTSSEGSGVMTLVVPANSDHDIKAGAVRPLWETQALVGQDFFVEAKFPTYLAVVGSHYKGQGIMAGAANGDVVTWLTYAFTAGGGHNNVHSSKIISAVETSLWDAGDYATGTMWLRMKKVGTSWSLYHSIDGTTWVNDVNFTLAITIDRIGPCVLNEGATSEAATSTVDYFRRIG